MKRFCYFSMICFAAVLAAIGCCNCRAKSRAAVALTGNTWQLVKLMGADVTPEGDSYTLSFNDEGRFAGVGACNRLMGGYEAAADGKLVIEYPASTRMMCPDVEREDLYFQVVSEAEAYEIDGETLMLLHDGEVRAVFALTKTDNE